MSPALDRPIRNHPLRRQGVYYIDHLLRNGKDAVKSIEWNRKDWINAAVDVFLEPFEGLEAGLDTMDDFQNPFL